MALHAAMIHRMDIEVGHIFDQIKAMGRWENTLVLFLSDNGASAEIMVRGDGHDPSLPPGAAGTFLSIGPGWATMANSPFRRHKTWTHEGGISTPLIASWPAGIAARGEFRTTPGHVIDVVPSLLELAGAKPRPGAPPAPGKSLVPVFTKDAGAIHDSLWWYHERNKAIQMGNWKAVEPRNSPWELYDLANDRGESTDLATGKPEVLKKLVTEWDRLAAEFTKVASSDLPAKKTAKAKRDATAVSSGDNPAARPAPRDDSWLAAHKKREARLQQGNVDVLLIGDSITAGWSKQPELIKKFFGDRQVVNLGHPADKTENILWRLRNHSFDKIRPGIAVVMAGTNNCNDDDYSAVQIAGGVQAIVAELRDKLPQTKILLLGIFPRGSREQRIEVKKGRTAASMNPQWEKIDQVNRTLSTFADGQKVVYLNINREFLNEKGELPVEVMPDLLHPNAKGYEIWGRAIQPGLKQ